MGGFQASMLEAFQSLRDKFSSFKKTSNQPEVEVDQTSVLASKPTTSSQAVNLDPPHPRPQPTSQSEALEVDYGPALPPLLGADHPHDNASDQPSCLSDEPSKVASARPKKYSRSHKRHDTEPRPASDQFQVSPRNLELPHLDPKSMLIKVNIK